MNPIEDFKDKIEEYETLVYESKKLLQEKENELIEAVANSIIVGRQLNKTDRQIKSEIKTLLSRNESLSRSEIQKIITMAQSKVDNRLVKSKT
jgi:hypothetical protein